MGEKEEEELKRYLLDSNVKILFEGKNPTPVEITELDRKSFRLLFRIEAGLWCISTRKNGANW